MYMRTFFVITEKNFEIENLGTSAADFIQIVGVNRLVVLALAVTVETGRNKGRSLLNLLDISSTGIFIK